MYPKYKSLSDRDQRHFLQVCACFFIFLMVSFKEHKFFTLIKPNLPYLFSFMVSASRNPRNLCCGHKAFLPLFSRCFYTWVCYLFLVNACVWQEIKVHYFSHMATQLFLHRFWKSDPFPSELLWPFCWVSVDCMCVFLGTGLCSICRMSIFTPIPHCLDTSWNQAESIFQHC